MDKSGRPENIPPWMSNPDYVAPCYCGNPILPGQPYMVGISDSGMRRAFHVPCYQMLQDDDE